MRKIIKGNTNEFKLCFSKHGDIQTEYSKLNDKWKDNYIELIWDINQIQKNYNCIVISQYGNNYSTIESDNIKLINIKKCGVKFLNSLVNNIIYIITTIYILKRNKISHFIPADFRGLCFIVFFCKLIKIKIIPNISRENHVTNYYQKLFTFFKVNDFIVPSNYYKKKLKKNNQNINALIRQPLYSDCFFEKKQIPEFQNGKFNVIFISRLIKAKGISEFLCAAVNICTCYKDINFYIVGDGEEKGSVLHFITDNNLKDRVIVLGNKENYEIGNYLLNSDVLVFPSYTEGFAKTWIEAIFTNTPMILTPINAIVNLLTDMQSCIFIPFKSVKEIEVAIISLYSDKELYYKIKKNLIEVKELLKNQKDGNFKECVLKLINQ